MRLARVASATLTVIALGAAEPAPAVQPVPAVPVPAAQPVQQAPREYTTQPTRTITLGNTDPKLVAKATLFVSEDNGASWHKAQELAVAADATQLPAFTFTAAADGTYGLWTAATLRDGRSEPEPVAGVQPKLILVVDRAAPVLDRLETTLGGVADGQATLALSWKASDPNLGKDPVSIEVSTDQGKSFAVRTSGAAEGTTGISVPVAAGSPEIQVRLIARDQAGNVLTSPAKRVALPVAAKPADPEAALAAAVAALPKPDELGVAARGGSPIVTAGESPLAPSADAPATAPAKPTQAQSAQSAKPAAQPAAGEQPPVVANQDVEGRFAQQANPNAGASTRTGRSSDQPAGDTAAPAVPASRRPTAVDPDAPYLTGSEASAELARARQLEQGSDVDAALASYLRLHRSSVAKSALADELALLRRVGDNQTIVGIANALPAELRTDLVRLHAARAAYALGDNAAAAAWASKVRASATEAREAMLVLARAIKALGKTSDARRLLDQLAAGSDDVAAQARAER